MSGFYFEDVAITFSNAVILVWINGLYGESSESHASGSHKKRARHKLCRARTLPYSSPDCFGDEKSLGTITASQKSHAITHTITRIDASGNTS